MPTFGYVTYTTPHRIMVGGWSPINEFLAENDLPELHLPEIARKEYVMRSGFQLRRGDNRNEYQGRVDFDGKIWLLVGPRTATTAEFAARLSKNTGFATLVGETTGGQVGGPLVQVALPNTGILFQMKVYYFTDQFGRPYDAGTIPHHFNREGYDALETVLQLIAEGNY